jgi:acyl-CoA thioesterase I
MRKIWILFAMALLCACSRQGTERAQPAPEDGRRMPEPAATALPDGRPTLVCFGDSLTAGHGLLSGESYPEVLQRELDRRGARFRVVNQGISGDTTQDGLARLPRAIAEKPRIVVLELGANDGLRGLPIAGTRRNLEQMIAVLKDSGARVVLAGITLPPNYGPDYIRNFEGIYTDLAAKYKLPLIPFLLKGVAGNARLMQSDGLHPTAEGTRLVAQTVARALDPVLAHP